MCIRDSGKRPGESQTEGLRQRAGRLRTGVYGVADPEKLAAAAGLYDQVYEDVYKRQILVMYLGEVVEICPAALRLYGPKRQPDSSLSLRELSLIHI